MMFFNFIAFRFLKSIFVLLVSLEFFFVSIDSLKYFDSFPDSINLIILFFVYDGMYALNYVLPISMLLGFVIFYIGLVRNNQFVALLSVGYSKKDILLPPLLISFLLIIIYIILNTTSFVYAQENAENIINQGSLNNTTENLFVKYGSNYVYFEKIYPLLQKAENIKVYRVIKEDSRILKEMIQAKEGFFIDNKWILENAHLIKLPDNYKLGEEGVQLENFPRIEILDGFRPKVLDTIYQSKPSVSINDALTSFFILHKEGSSTNRVRSILYSLIVIPFFIMCVGMIIARFSPVFARYGNIASKGILFSIISLLLWGMFFSLSRLSANDLFIPEIGLLIPFFILLVISIIYFRQLNRI